MKDSLGDRIKHNYENRNRSYLTRRTPVIMRLDGKAFHTLTRSCTKPFDIEFSSAMVYTAHKLLKEIQGAKCAYTQSDEISILITDYETLETEAWFDYNVQKITSVAAAVASLAFSDAYKKEGIFDCRVFNIPKEEVCNYFIWRQKDWIRNSIQMLARKHFSHKELHNKKIKDIHDMLYTKNINWADLEDRWKNGIHIENGSPYGHIIYTKDRSTIEKFTI